MESLHRGMGRLLCESEHDPSSGGATVHPRESTSVAGRPRGGRADDGRTLRQGGGDEGSPLRLGGPGTGGGKRAMTRRWTTAALVLGVGAGLLVACATIQNNPEQARTWAAYRACKAAGRAEHGQYDGVDPGGRAGWSAASPTRSSYGSTELEACMQEQLAKTK